MLDAAQVKELANGRWDSILLGLGVDELILNRKNQPCPSCNGSDRFQYTNYKDDGSYHCRGCGSGDGFNLLNITLSLEFKEALKQVADFIGVSSVDAKPVPNTKRRDYLRDHMLRLSGNDPASLYLKRRKIYSSKFSHIDIGYLLFQKYYEDNQVIGEYPILIAAVRDIDGGLITYLITHLTAEGEKADVKVIKKLISPITGKSPAIYPYGFERMNKEEIGVCEGLEDSLSASKLFKIPVAGIVGTSLMEKYMPNENVKYLTAFIQDDKNYAGQCASFKMLKTLADKTELNLDYKLSENGDFNDMLMRASNS